VSLARSESHDHSARAWKGSHSAGALLAVTLACANATRAHDWWPHPEGATWTYVWTDSVYNPTPGGSVSTVVLIK
jgi:hypothetical protein